MPHPADAVSVFVNTVRANAGDDELLLVPSWTRGDWETLFAYAAPVSIKAGTVLIRKDESERSLYLVTRGLLHVTAVLSSHSLAALAKIKPGSIVGELAFLDGRPRSAKVWGVVDSEVYRLEYQSYCEFSRQYPSLACSLTFGIARLVALRWRRSLKAANA